MNNKGFTLVEVMGAIAIVAILLVGGTLVVTSVMERQKQKIHEENIKTIKDAAITYVLNKKFYVPVCKDTAGGLVTIDEDKAIKANNIIENSYSSIRGNFTELNKNAGLKSALSGTSGVFGNIKDDKCYKLISVETLKNEGFVEKVDDCNIAMNSRYSVIIVYAMGDAADPTGPGQLVAVSDKNLCS